MTNILTFDPAADPVEPVSTPAPDALAMTERAVKLLAGVENPSAPVITALALVEQVREFLAAQKKGEP